MEALLTLPAERLRHQAAGLEQVQALTWRRSAALLLRSLGQNHGCGDLPNLSTQADR